MDYTYAPYFGKGQYTCRIPLDHPPQDEILNEYHFAVRISIFTCQIVSQSNWNLPALDKKLLGTIDSNRVIWVEATILLLK